MNPNFGGEVMVVSLGCEKLQPGRLLPPGSFAIVDECSGADAALDVVCLQEDAHVGFMSMVDSVVRQAEQHLERLNARRREAVPASGACDLTGRQKVGRPISRTLLGCPR